eukprot:CAMPEP_0203665394 /NCGR_PEP_ID=MMETSP0090-20130426/2602_1 /ASSEMBLY_ACC=CAM_ASM_001088 /TAXON_ID=426623 /ORGANISM="Chaetoceros affinis, Strain CCMP159" /LENGTH=276 /DNA_ID=CAMNT_0050528919 /DNA_START=80 /DNA_END=907 /DNA_ORIENTATION=+
MKLSSTSAIIFAAALFSGESGLVKAKNAKEFQQKRRRTLLKKNKNKNDDQNVRSMKEASLKEPMQVQEGSRQDYAPMMDEYTETSEWFEGEEVPMYQAEEEVMGMAAMGEFEEEPLDEGIVYYTQGDIDRMVDTMDMEMDGYYDADMEMMGIGEPSEDPFMDMEDEMYNDTAYYLYEEEEELSTLDIEEAQEEYEHMLEEEELYAEMGLEKEAAYEAALMEEKFGREDVYEEDEEAYEFMLQEEERYAEMGLEAEAAFDGEEWDSKIEEEEEENLW